MDTNLSDQEMSELDELLDGFAVAAEIFDWQANNGSVESETQALDDKLAARRLIVEFCQKLKGN